MAFPVGPTGMLAAGAYGAVLSLLRLRWGLRAALTGRLVTDIVLFGWVGAHAIYLPR